MNQSSSHNSSATNSKGKKPLGQLLSEAGLISARQIELALQDQINNNLSIKIGEIFASRGWIKQATADFFVEQWHNLVSSPTKHPLVYYFRKAALLSEAQINEILEEKNNSPKKVRFHHLAVRKGLIKQETVDFFLRNLLISHQSEKSSNPALATPYELLKNYIRGETDFQGSQLKKIKLNHVTLKGVNLSHSNLMGAELKQANLSNSSLKLVNLSNANLEKAILKEVDFENACLNQVNLTDAHLEGSNFKSANLTEADLRDGYFVNVCFFGADLRHAKLQGANFEGASYNLETTFDSGLDPAKMGMKLV